MSSISAIVPNFNHGKWIGETLLTLVTQEPPPSEVIVVDDGSTDNSIAVVKYFQERYSTIRLIRHEVNRGTAAAMNTGFAAAKGEFLFFIGADDMILPGMFACALASLQAQPQAAFFCTEVALVDTDLKVIGTRPFIVPFRRGYVSPSDVRRHIRASDNWCVGQSTIFRHRFLTEIGGFDEALGSMCDGMATRLLAFRHGFYFEPKVLSVWRIYPESLSAHLALSLSDNKRSGEIGAHWVAKHFPADVSWYADLYNRRVRFNMARLFLQWHQGPVGMAICDLLELGAWDRAALRLAERVPIFSRFCVLAWLTMRICPYSRISIIQESLRKLFFGNFRRRKLHKMLTSCLVVDRPRS